MSGRPRPPLGRSAALGAGLARTAGFAAALLTGCSGGETPSPLPPGDACAAEVGQSAQALRHGQLDADDAAVAAVNTLDVDCQRAGAPACTGTLIAPDVVVTAAHCVGKYPPESFGVLFGALSDPGRGPLGSGLEGSFFRVIGIRVHPLFDPAALTHDLALLHLAEAPAVAPIPRLEAPLDPSLVGTQARVVGYGYADEGPGNAKRRGTVTMTAISAAEIVYRSGPAMTCSGDSGGPVFLTINGAERIAGVTSRGDEACVDHGVAERLDEPSPDFFEAAW